MNGKRATRVAERIREALARLIRDLEDPRVQGAIVSRVEVGDDLSIAHVFLRVAVGAPDEKAQRALVKGFGAASHRLRKETARAVGLRYAPDLRFHYDEGPDAATRIEELLGEVERERRGE